MHGVGGKALAGPQEAVEGSRDAGPQHGLILCAIVRPGQVLMENLESVWKTWQDADYAPFRGGQLPSEWSADSR